MNFPIGSIIAWHKSKAFTPGLPGGWVECNGQTLSDPDSPYNGGAIPNLNGEGRFLRGAATSGTNQDDAFQGWAAAIAGSSGGNEGNVGGLNGTGSSGNIRIGSAPNSGAVFYPRFVSDGTSGTPRVASETRPVNMSVVWIMKVKEVEHVGSPTNNQPDVWIEGHALKFGRYDSATSTWLVNMEMDETGVVDDDTWHKVGDTGEPAFGPTYSAVGTGELENLWFTKKNNTVYIQGACNFSAHAISEMVNNGDCETTTAPILVGETTPVLSNASWARSADQHSVGTYSYKLTDTAGSIAYAGLFDTHSYSDMHGLTAGKSYRLRAKVYVPSSGGPSNLDEVRASINIGRDGTLLVAYGVSPTTYDAWNVVDYTFTVPTVVSGVSIRFYLAATVSAGEYAYWDDIHLEEVDRIFSLPGEYIPSQTIKGIGGVHHASGDGYLVISTGGIVTYGGASRGTSGTCLMDNVSVTFPV